MKKLTFPLIILFIALLIVINYYAYKSPKSKQLITQNKVHTIINDQKLYVDLYSNYQSPFHNKEAIETVYLEDKKGENRWLLEILSISKEAKYEYLFETYTNYLFCFSLPHLTTNLEMSDAYLKVILKNGEVGSFLIGSFNFYYQTDQNLAIASLHATKKNDLLEIETLSLKLELAEDIKVNYIKVGNYIYYYDQVLRINETLIIAIPPLMKIADSLSVIINYESHNQTYLEALPHFIFFENYENPLSYGILNNVYPFN